MLPFLPILPVLSAPAIHHAMSHPIQSSTTISLDLSKPGLAVSPLLYGLMTEEINYSYDGGLYGELVRNRAFRGDREKPVHWEAVGGLATIALDRDHGVNESLPVSLRLDRGTAVGPVGIANEGYWGIPVRPSTTYRVSFWAKADVATPVSVRLASAQHPVALAVAEVGEIGTAWRKYEATLTTGTGFEPTKIARLLITTTGAKTVWFSLVSLFPPTHNDRPNGNRPDLMEKLIAMRPKFLRFPGGNYLEGDTFRDRFPWKETLGPLETRPGHQGTWGYRSSDGMGLLEFLHWSEDMNARPVLGIFAGYVLNRDVVKAGTELEGFVKDALDEIEYVIGDAKTTKWGRRRAQDGHPKPFDLAAVEVGNEDGFDRTGSYEDRFVQFYDAIKAKYPKLNVISTTGGKDSLGTPFPITKRKPDLIDEHYYASTWDMMAMATKYDDYDRKGAKIFVGEWAAQDVPEPWTKPETKGPTPNLNCAIADAAFMTGMERNADIVHMSCYAPLLVNVNTGGRQWAVNLIGYDALASFGSPSYYAQAMFAQALGDRTVPLTLTGAPTQSQGDRTLPGLFSSATRDGKSGRVFLKVVNALSTEQEVVFELKGATVAAEGTLTVLQGELTDVNSLAEPTKVAPAKSRLNGLGATFRRKVPAHSVSVIELTTKR